MPQHYIDPNDYAVDTDVTSLFADYGLSSTVEVTVREDVNGKYLELYSTTGTGPTFLEHLASSGDTGVEDAEILIKQEVTTQTTSLIYCIARGNSERDGYGASYFGNATSAFRLNRFNDGVFDPHGSVIDPAIANGTLVWQRFRVNGTDQRARLWEDGTQEPEVAWDVSTSSATYVIGFAGLGFYNDNTRTTYKCYWLGIGTDGDEAPEAPTGGGTAQTTVSEAASCSAVWSAVATAPANLADQADISDSPAAIAQIAAGLTEAVSAQDSDAAPALALAAIQAGSTGNALFDAVAQASAALVAGAAAGESWVAQAQSSVSWDDAAQAGSVFSGSEPQTYFVNDNFTDTNGTLLQNHTPDDGGSWSRHPASDVGVDFQIANNRAWPEDNKSIYYHSAVPSGAEYDITAVFKILTQPEGGVGLFARLDTAAETGYMVLYSEVQAAWRLYKAVGGSLTLLDTASEALSDGATRTVRFEVRDAAKRVYIDDVLTLSSTDNSITAAGRVGIRNDGAGNTSTVGTHLESIQAQINTAEQAILTAGTTASDAFAAAVASIAALTGAASVSEAATATLLAIGAVSEGAQAADAAGATAQILAAIGESLTADSLYTAGAAVATALSSSISISDAWQGFTSAGGHLIAGALTITAALSATLNIKPD